MRLYIYIIFLQVISASLLPAQEMQGTGGNVSNMKVSNPGSPLNSTFADFNPVLSADESIMIFSSRRGEGKTVNKEDKARVYISYKKNSEYSEPTNIGSSINGNSDNIVAGLSPDGKNLFICRNDNGNKDLFMSSLSGKIWQKPVKLGSGINSASDETTASISPDGAVLYFSSNKTGGYGGFDIYFSRKLPNGDWGEALNLGNQVNTKEDEICPYIHPDGYSIFFSSKGHGSSGGFDIFFSSFNDDNTCSAPLNFGPPVNSENDETFYSPTAEGKRAWFCSTRPEGLGGTDIFMISATSSSKLLSAITGYVKLENAGNAENVEITLSDNESKEMTGKYIPNPKTGKFLIILSPRKSYLMICEAPGYLPSVTALSVSRKTSYQESETAVVIDTILLRKNYQFNSFNFLEADTFVSPRDEAMLEMLTDFLKTSKVQIEIIGNESNVSPARTRSLMNYFRKAGIREDRIYANYQASGKNNKMEVTVYVKSFENSVPELMKSKGCKNRK